MHKYVAQYRCFVCGATFWSDIQSRRLIDAYNIAVCDHCYSANSDGWAPQIEQNLIQHLEWEGLPIPLRNESGRLPRDG